MKRPNHASIMDTDAQFLEEFLLGARWRGELADGRSIESIIQDMRDVAAHLRDPYRLEKE